MSTETRSAVAVENAPSPYTAGAVAGLVGSAVMAVLMLARMQGVLEQATPAMYGLSGPALGLGFGIHLLHGAVFGLAFAVLVTKTPVADVATTQGLTATVGLMYGVAVWLVAAVLVMPVWLGVVGFPNAPAVPNVQVQSLVGHVVFGVVLGLTYPLFGE